jgi:dihydroorotase
VKALAGAEFEPLMTLYLTDNTQPAEIERAAASGFVKAVKYYPAGATTNSDSGVTDLRKCDAVFEAMAAARMPLLVPRRSDRRRRGPLRSRGGVHRALPRARS